jgi:tetratricopeptide (TPR) repeat protein
MRFRVRPGVTLLMLAVIAAASSTPSAQDVPPHHCRLGGATAVRDLPPARPMHGIGTAHLKITTAAPLAQRYFDQGLNLLHAFWDTEAYRAFKEAARLDPDAAMPQWGLYMSLAQNAQEMAGERAAALTRAVDLARRASEHERHYIRAIAAQADPAKGRAAYIAEMEALIDRFPSDVEAQLLLANTLSTPASSYAPDGRPREGKLYGQTILRHLLRTHPGHAAVHHYWVHAVENGPRPADGLASAAALRRLAPRSGHMVHMPGHLYYRLGRFADARRAFLESMVFDEAYMRAEGMHPINNWNYVHNLDYLVATAAESGQYDEGLKYAEQLRDVRAPASRAGSSGIGYLTFGGHTAVARLQLRFARWHEAADTMEAASRSLSVDSPVLRGYYAGVRAYALGMSAAQHGRIEEAALRLKELQAVLAPLANERAQSGGDWYFRHALGVLQVNARELEGMAASAKGDHDRALTVLRDAADAERNLGYWEPPHYARPVLESLATAAVRAGRFDEALAAYNAVLVLRPNSYHALRGLERVRSKRGL